MNHRRILVALSLVLAACGTDSSDPGDVTVEACDSEGMTLTGLVDVTTPSAATVEVNSAVIGIAGILPGASETYTLTVRAALTGQLATVGTYDVAATHMTYLATPADADCQTPGACSGFIATAGTLEVLSTAPYRAEFTFDTLHAHDGSSDTLGPAITGAIVGCLQAAP